MNQRAGSGEATEPLELQPASPSLRLLARHTSCGRDFVSKLWVSLGCGTRGAREQYALDLPRQVLRVNGRRVTSWSQMRSRIPRHLARVAQCLCTQASFAWQWELVFDRHRNTQSRASSDLHVTQLPSHCKTDLVLRGDELEWRAIFTHDYGTFDVNSSLCQDKVRAITTLVLRSRVAATVETVLLALE